MKASYILIQAVGLVGTVLFFLSFQCRSNKKLFRVQFLSYLFYTVHLFLLGATTGAVSYVINTLRSFCLGSKYKPLKGTAACVCICVLQLAALALTWNGWKCMLPVAANIASTLGGYSHNPRKVRAAGMFINSPLWIVYDILVGSWAGILDEAVSEASMLISVLRYGWKNLDRVEE